ncbi:MAG: putative Ubiquitin-conjugating enzyme E2 W [Streblomastix strix]|uniref:Putative Ubiquitin-conjugating enzyme E2 W n=1 Tax=Streblomastix strix TaxID=222440 RepID=A0A5J4WUI2_9EUKA|nr:MAG: putative Ubiquitin-conjugating enzyme E2 W [Streblomastix strix]
MERKRGRTTTIAPAQIRKKLASNTEDAQKKKVVLAPQFAQRLMKELKMIQSQPLDFIKLDEHIEDMSQILVYLSGPKDSIFEGENFTLSIQITDQYPMESPIVVFVPPMHVYSNGHICLSILYDQWTPTIGIRGICLSIVSMLASAKVKKRPPDDKDYSKTASDNPKLTQWDFHDKFV